MKSVHVGERWNLKEQKLVHGVRRCKRLRFQSAVLHMAVFSFLLVCIWMLELWSVSNVTQTYVAGLPVLNNHVRWTCVVVALS